MSLGPGPHIGRSNVESDWVGHLPRFWLRVMAVLAFIGVTVGGVVLYATRACADSRPAAPDLQSVVEYVDAIALVEAVTPTGTIGQDGSERLATAVIVHEVPYLAENISIAGVPAVPPGPLGNTAVIGSDRLAADRHGGRSRSAGGPDVALLGPTR